MSYWQTFTSKFLSWMSKREVKTPLSFFFRLATAVLLLTGIAVVVDPHDSLKFLLLAFVMWILMFIGVYVFAWVKPKHLVYGETGHRAETKLGLGTEKGLFSAEEFAALEGTTNVAAQTVTLKGSPLNSLQGGRDT
jgi:hypothetical protein